jgi:hypothetical protein
MLKVALIVLLSLVGIAILMYGMMLFAMWRVGDPPASLYK